MAKLAKPSYRANGSSSSTSVKVVQKKITDYAKPEPVSNGNDLLNGQTSPPASTIVKKRSRSSSDISQENDSLDTSDEIKASKGKVSKSKQTDFASEEDNYTPRRRRKSTVTEPNPLTPSSDKRIGLRRAALIAKRQSSSGSRYSPEVTVRRRGIRRPQNTYSKRTRRSHSRESDTYQDLEESSLASSSLDFDEEDAGDFSLYMDGDDNNSSKMEVEASDNFEDSLSSTCENISDPYNTSPGDLMWGRVGAVYWACAITQDPSILVHTQIVKKGRNACLKYHVQFFGKPSRAWVSKANLIPYLGVDEYYSRVQNAKSKSSVTVRRKLLRELIPQTQKHQWQEAFDEMAEIESLSVEERVLYLKKRLDEPGQIMPKRRESYTSVSSSKEKVKRGPSVITKVVLSPKVVKKSQDTEMEQHRLMINKIPLDVLEENSRKLTTGYKLFKLAKLAGANKEMEREDLRDAERQWNQAWNLFSKADRQFYTDAASKLNSNNEAEPESTTDDMVVEESVVSRPESVNTPTEDHHTIKVTSSIAPKLEKMPYSTKNSFKKESFCIKCEKVSKEEGDLLKCNGVCHNHFHNSCLELEESVDLQTWKCSDCVSNQHSCFICKSNDGNRERCSISSCGKFYHRECLRSSLWPQARFSETQITCPYHMCHTCASDDPKDPHMKYSSKLLKCTRCPTSFHSGDYCVTAGTYQITALDIICPKHFVPPKGKKQGNHHINISWCFICSTGGSLICCELCPSSFHPGCINLDITPDVFYCTNCETGRMPLYGEVLWTKLGHYRWWPAQVMFPDELPQNVLKMTHDVGQFAVQFCGSKEFYWMNNGRCFPYQEGDSDRLPGGAGAGGSSLDSSFVKGIQEASKLFEEYMENKSNAEKLNESKVRAQPHLRPPLYTKIKSNKPYGDCTIHNAGGHIKCDCVETSNDPCGPTSNCINRLLLVECQPNVCTMGDRCGNRMFQKKIYPPLRVQHTKTKGWGLFVKNDIKKGDFIIEYVGELITSEEFKKRIGNMLNNKDADQNYYFMVIDNSRVIDAGPKGNYARFINHSCDPNCETIKWTVNGDTRIGIFALEDIPANTELTFNYQFEAFGEVKKPCLCGAKNCCGLIGEKLPPKRPTAGNTSVVAVSKKKKQKKDKKEKISINKYDDWCYRCYNSSTILDEEVENLILCDFKGCLKSYHLGCVSRDTVPHGKWFCPWHHCVTCGKLASSWCDHCPNGYCKNHAAPLKKHPVLKNVCDEHVMDLADLLRYYQCLSSEYKQDSLLLITEPQVILTEGVTEPKRRRVSQNSLPHQDLPDLHELVNCEVDFCSWYGTKQTLLEHMEALHSSQPKKPWPSDGEKPVRPREATFRCPIENCKMETRASLLRRHIQAKHPKIYREKYCDETVFLMEMTRAKVGTPRAPVPNANTRFTRSPKVFEDSHPASPACVPCLLPDCKKFIHHSNMARHLRSLHSDIDYTILKNNSEEFNVPPEPALILATQTKVSQKFSPITPKAYPQHLASTTPTNLKGNFFICKFGDCNYVSKFNSNMWRHRRKYGHFVTDSEHARQFFFGQEGDTELPEKDTPNKTMSGSEAETDKEVDTSSGKEAVETPSEEPPKIETDKKGILGPDENAPQLDSLNQTVISLSPEGAILEVQNINSVDTAAAIVTKEDVKQESVEVSSNVLCQSELKGEPVVSSDDANNTSLEPLCIDESNA